MNGGVAVVAALLLIVEALGAALAFFILQRGQGDAGIRWLARFLLIHGVAFGFWAFQHLVWSLGSTTYSSFVDQHLTSTALIQVLIGFLGVPLLFFVVNHPTPAPLLERSPGLGLVFWTIPSAAASIVGAEVVGSQVDLAPGLEGERIGGILMILAFALSALLAVAILVVRRGHATTRLERRRLTFSLHLLAVPLLVAAVGILVTVAAGIVLLSAASTLDEARRIATVLQALLVPLLLVFALTPPFGLAYGVLRYRLLDIDLRLRFTLRRSLVASAFLATFFVALQVAEYFIQSLARSALVAVLLLVPLVFLLHPIQRVADRIAGRVLPGTHDAEKYREFRRWEVYRATFEDLSRDGVVTPAERRALEALATTLRLDPTIVTTIEYQVRRERQGTVPLDAPS